jgi:site-specific recombinase XerD
MHGGSYGFVNSGRGQRGSLTQLNDGRWQARYRENGRSGSRPQRTFTKRRDAEQWLRDMLGEVDQVRDGDRRPVVRRRERATTASEGIERFLATVDVAPPTKRAMAERLRVFARAFGARPVQSLEPDELEAWRLTISPGWRADVFADTRRMFRSWERWGWIVSNPAAGIINRRARAAEVTAIPWETVLALEGEIDRKLEHIPVLASGTGLRPEEWLALHRADVDVKEGVLHVRRVFSSGRVVELGRDGTKTYRQRRRVPLRACVIERLQALPARIDTPILTPSLRKSELGYLTGASFRRIWGAAYMAAGLPYQRPYDMRHTYASESIAAGINLFDLSRFMGTSLREIDETYGHLVADSEERGRALLDAYDTRLGRVAEVTSQRR